MFNDDESILSQASNINKPSNDNDESSNSRLYQEKENVLENIESVQPSRMSSQINNFEDFKDERTIDESKNISSNTDTGIKGHDEDNLSTCNLKGKKKK